MDDTLQELENELKRLPPRRPSAALGRALENELGATSPATGSAPLRLEGSRPDRWSVWALGGLAAALGLVAVWQSGARPATPIRPEAVVVSPVQPSVSVPSPAGTQYEPVQATSVLYDLQEDGRAVLPDQTEGRQLRYRYVDTYTWKNATTNASLRWSVPRDEVRLIRANLD